MEQIKNTIKVFMLHGLALLFVLLSTVQLRANEISVVEVKRNITLADDDPVYKDFYLNAGYGSPLRKNMVVNVKRKITIKDTGSKTIGDLEATVGQLKIIHIGNKVAVGREFKLLPRDEEPMLEQIGMMMGDRIDLANSFIDNSKPNYKRKTTETEALKATEEAKAPTAPPAATSASAVTNPVVLPVVTTVELKATETTRKPAEALKETLNETSKETSLLQKIIPMPTTQGL